MVEKVQKLSCDVVDFARYQSDRDDAGKLSSSPSRACRHCGAALFADESDEECSSVFNVDAASPRAPRKSRANRS